MSGQNLLIKAVVTQVLLAFSPTHAQGGDAVVTWYIGSGNGNETLKFTTENFAGYQRCMCGKTINKCTVYTRNGFMSYVQYGTPDTPQNSYLNTYVCQRSSNPALLVICSRLDASACTSVESYPFWSFDKISEWEDCAVGEVKVVWDSSQSFRITHNSSVIISRGSVDCSSSPTPAAATTTTTTTTTTPASLPTTTLSAGLTSTTISTEVSSNGTKHDKSPQQSDDGDNTGVIVGVVVAILICGILLAVGFVWWWRKQKTRKSAVNGDNQLSAYPVEIIRGGFNAFAEHRTRANGNAYVPNSSVTSDSSRTPADPAIANGDNTGYYNLRSINNNHISAFENIAAHTPKDDQSNRHAKGDHAGRELPLPPEEQSNGYFKTANNQAPGDGMDYEEVSDSDNILGQDHFSSGDHSQEVDNFYEIPVIPAVTTASGGNGGIKGDPRYESVHFKGPRVENMYSEINDFAESTNKEDIVPPKRNRFLQPPPKAAKPDSSVYGLARSTNNSSDALHQNHGGATSGQGGSNARFGNSNLKSLNLPAYGDNSKDLDYSGSQKYFELESKASIRVKTTDSPEESRVQRPYSSAEPIMDNPYEDPDRKTDS